MKAAALVLLLSGAGALSAADTTLAQLITAVRAKAKTLESSAGVKTDTNRSRLSSNSRRIR